MQKGLRSEIAFFDLIQRFAKLPTLLPSGGNIRFTIAHNGQVEAEWLVGFDDKGQLSQIQHWTRTMSNESNLESALVQLITDDNAFVRLCRDPTFKLQDVSFFCLVLSTFKLPFFYFQGNHFVKGESGRRTRSYSSN